MLRRILLFLFLMVFLTGCNEKGARPNANSNAAKPTNVKTGVKPQPDSQVVVIETADYGRIVIELYPNIAPQMVERFKKLVSEKFYDGTAIHRIDPELGIIQGGDPNTKTPNVAMWGRGDSTYPDVSAEFSDVPYERGTVGAARQGPPPGSGLPEEQFFNTANCQWFITVKKQPAFDQKYTVFGRVVDGIKNAEIIMGAPTAESSERPADKIAITSVTLQPRVNYPNQ